MKSFAALLILTTGVTLAAAQSTASKTKTPEVGTFQASPEMRRLLDAFAGEWNVKEVYDLAGVSGKSVAEHPEAKRMLADVKRGHITNGDSRREHVHAHSLWCLPT